MQKKISRPRFESGKNLDWLARSQENVRLIL